MLRQTVLAFALAAVPGLASAQTAMSGGSKMAPATTSTPATGGTTSSMAKTPMTAPASSAPTATKAGMPGHFSSESAAASSCPGDTVVWASPRSKALHTSGSAHYGKTKSGFYACEKEAIADGFHLAGTGGHHHKKA